MNLAKHYTDRGDSVLMISRSKLRPPPFTLGLEDSTRFKYAEAHLVMGLHRMLVLLDAFSPDVIVNFAALCEVGLSWTHDLDYYNTNLISLVRLTNELQTRSWFKRFVQIGSSEVYGSVGVAAREEDPLNPSSPYAVSKGAFDLHLRVMARHRAFPAVICMPSNGYCEGQTLNRIIPKTIIACLKGEMIQLQGGGVARKSYLHGDDISRAIILVEQEGKIGETYNVGPPSSISIKELVEKLAGKFGKTLQEVARIAPERLGQDSQYLLNSDKISSLGWKQKVELDEGLDRMIAWVKKYPELLTMDQTYKHHP